MYRDAAGRGQSRARLGRLICLGLVAWLLAGGCGAPLPSLPDRDDPNAPSVRVAVLVPMTGELATFGKVVRNGAGLAFDEWNERGGVRGEHIHAVLEDTPCDAGQARQAVERVIATGVRFIVGGMCAEAAIPIARLADEKGVLFVATNATHPLVTVDDSGAVRRLAFRVAFAYPYQGRAVARFLLKDLQVNRAAILSDPADPFVRSLADEFAAAFAAGGGEVVAATYAMSDAHWGLAVAGTAHAGAQVLYVPGGAAVANRVGGAVRMQSLDITIIGSDLWAVHEMDRQALEGAYFVAHYNAGAFGPIGQAWDGRYQSAFAVEPDTLAALGYDAANLLITAIAQSASPSPPDVARTLENLEYAGASGRWRYDAWHNPLKDAVIMQVKAEGIRSVGVASVR